MTGEGHNWSVRVEGQGRSGTITYHEGHQSQIFDWEFGGTVVAIIYCRGSWLTAFADREGEILRRVATEVIRQKAPTCQADIEEDGTIYIREIEP